MTNITNQPVTTKVSVVNEKLGFKAIQFTGTTKNVEEIFMLVNSEIRISKITKEGKIEEIEIKYEERRLKVELGSYVKKYDDGLLYIVPQELFETVHF